MAELKPTEMQRFFALRKRLFDAIRETLEEDSHCKSYEGAFEITQCFPNYFEHEYGGAGNQAVFYVIELHCYVIGPYRHYRWDGRTFDEALGKAERQIGSWLRGMEDE